MPDKGFVTTKGKERLRALPLSYPGVWSRRRDSNPRPRRLQRCSSFSIRHEKGIRGDKFAGNNFQCSSIELRDGLRRHGRTRTGNRWMTCSFPGIRPGKLIEPRPRTGHGTGTGSMPHALGQAGSTAGDKWGERMDGALRRARIPRDLNPPALRRYLYSHRHSPAKSVKDRERSRKRADKG